MEIKAEVILRGDIWSRAERARRAGSHRWRSTLPTTASSCDYVHLFIYFVCACGSGVTRGAAGYSIYANQKEQRDYCCLKYSGGCFLPDGTQLKGFQKNGCVRYKTETHASFNATQLKAFPSLVSLKKCAIMHAASTTCLKRQLYKRIHPIASWAHPDGIHWGSSSMQCYTISM